MIVRAYDFFDLVQVCATVYRSPDTIHEAPEVILQRAVVIAGRGEVEPSVWLRDALNALL